jgi:hypothetical protein
MQLDKRTLVVSLLVLAAALTRLIPHPLNFSPIGAMALFGGCYIADKRWAFVLPLAAMFISDTILEIVNGSGFHPIILWVYGSFIAITCLGFYLRGREQRQTIMVLNRLCVILYHHQLRAVGYRLLWF